ncbi:hypothetical protein D3C75_785070 [compost metagenome]
MRRTRNLTLNDPEYLVQLFHQIALILQSACCIADQHVYIPLLRSLYRIKHDRCRVGPRLLFNNVYASPLSPDFKLLNRSGTKRITCSQENLFAFLFVAVRQLADSCRLADTVDSNKQNNRDAVRILLQAVVVVTAQQLHQLAGENRLQLRCILNSLLLHFGSQLFYERHYRVYAYVCTDQNFFQFLVELFIYLFAADDQVRDLFDEALACLLQSVAEAFGYTFRFTGNAFFQFFKKAHMGPPKKYYNGLLS